MELMSSKKLYLDSSISLQKVASALGTNRSYLSKAINLELNQGFSTTVNSLRIKEAITIITHSNSEKIGVSGLATDTGLGSRTAFIAAFSKYTGMLPSTFINNYKAICKTKQAKNFDFE
jgi:YesN/AraC family two-component response regulator